MKARDFDWPENLFLELGIDPPYSDGQISALEQCLKTLTERERGVLDARYVRDLTLEKTGKEFGVTRERIRQIEAKTLRKLRHPSRLHGIEAGLDVVEQVNAAKERYLAAQREYEVKTAELIANTELLSRILSGEALPDDLKAAPDIMRAKENWQLDISEMGLSVRSYNCLKRAGYDTIGSLAGVTEMDLMKVRNLGRKSMKETITRLKDFGINVERAKWDGGR